LTNTFQKFEIAASLAEGNCSGDITKILEYLEMGKTDIERTEIEEIVIVVGPSGVGKSTLVQFVANSTNTLRAECKDGKCLIVDDSETIGDEIISKTFLPNLVLENDTQTPFYDMPGFQDNRDAAIEIANSFFIKQVIDESKAVKIITLARSSSFAIQDKGVFPTLIKTLVDLIKKPEKFATGSAIIATMADKKENHKNLISQYVRFLKCDLLDNLEGVFEKDREYIEGARKLITTWIPNSVEKSCEKDSFSDTYVAYFRTPEKAEPLANLSKMVANKEKLDTLIWTDMNFITKEEGDFGLPLSVGAIKLLEDTGYCIGESISSAIAEYTEALGTKIEQEFSKFINNQEVNVGEIADILNNLMSLDLDFSRLPENSPSSWANKLLEILDLFETPLTKPTKQIIVDAMEYFNFIELSQAKILLKPEDWTSFFTTLQANTRSESHKLASAAYERIKTEMESFSKSAEEYFTEQLQLVSTGAYSEISTLKGRLITLTEASYSFAETENESFVFYIDKITSTITPFGGDLAIKPVQSLNSCKEILSTLGSFLDSTIFYPSTWVASLKDIKGHIIAKSSSYAKLVQEDAYDQIVSDSRKVSTHIMSAVAMEKDVYDKRSKLPGYFSTANKIKESLEVLIKRPTTTLQDILKSYTVEFEEIQNCNCYGNAKLESVALFEVLDDFGWDTIVWTLPIQNNVCEVIQDEINFTEFLIQLYLDLTLPQYQSGNNVVRTWWLNTKYIDSKNVDMFYTKISQTDMKAHSLLTMEVLRKLALDSDTNTKRIELVLDTTIEDDTCPSGLEKTFKQNFVSVERALSCLGKSDTTVAILATTAIYMDQSIIGKNINLEKNVELFMMTSSFEIVDNSTKIDLGGGTPNGQENLHGKEGYPAGTFYFLYDELKTADNGNSFEISTTELKGGSGTNGAKGNKGATGTASSTMKSFSAKTDCDAWRGRIKVKVTPNSCGGKCDAGNNGKTVDIYGGTGGTGRTGGTGGNGGSGGAGGHSIVKAVGIGNTTELKGLSGSCGSPGEGGDGGDGGFYGPSLRVTVDDHLSGTNFVCEEKSRSWPIDPVLRGPTGSRGAPGSYICKSDVRSIDQKKIKQFTDLFVSQLEIQRDNEFLSRDASQMLAKLK